MLLDVSCVAWTVVSSKTVAGAAFSDVDVFVCVLWYVCVYIYIYICVCVCLCFCFFFRVAFFDDLWKRFSALEEL